MKSNPFRGVAFGLMAGAAMRLSGCAVYDAAVVGLHDSLDELKNEKSTTQVSTSDLPSVGTDTGPSTASPAFSGEYSSGSKSTDGGPEIWLSNWQRMNIRVHVNPGEFRALGIKSAGPWYPMDMSKAATDAVVLTKTDDGCTITAKDFISTTGQAYHVEGFRADGVGTFTAGKVLKLTPQQMRGAVFVWLASVK